MTTRTTYHVFQPLADGRHEIVVTGDGSRAGIGIVQGENANSWILSREEVETFCTALRKAAGIEGEHS